MIWLCTTEKEQSACLLNSLHEPWCCSKCHLPDSSHPSMWFTSLTQTYQTPKVQPVKFKPTNLPFPQLCADTDTHVWGKSKRTHMDAFMHAHEKLHANARSPFQSHSLLLFQNISCFHAATYASWMFASDIQINGAAKCATSVLLQPTLGGCTTLFSATSSQPSPGRQLRDKTIHCY